MKEYMESLRRSLINQLAKALVPELGIMVEREDFFKKGDLFSEVRRGRVAVETVS